MDPSKLKLLIASDHGGYELKEAIKAHFSSFDWKDLGCNDRQSVDYPDYAETLVQQMEPQSLGVLICGTGQGMCMSANKNPTIRAALCWNEDIARLAREHNDANILCLSGRFLEKELALRITDIFLHTQFEGGRHARRIAKFSKDF